MKRLAILALLALSLGGLVGYCNPATVNVHDSLSIGFRESVTVTKYDGDCAGDAHAAAVRKIPVCGSAEAPEKGRITR